MLIAVPMGFVQGNMIRELIYTDRVLEIKGQWPVLRLDIRGILKIGTGGYRGLMTGREPTSCAAHDTRRSATAGRAFCFPER